jgi:radical SAM superfamily enzyme YgiQ (UPF0313 family)
MLTFVEPLGPICVAACLEQDGHVCKVIDLRIDGEEKGLADCVAFDPDVVGLQCNFTTERNRTIRLAQRVKQLMPKAIVVIGGHDSSRDPDWFRHDAIDYIAIGDGEEVMPPLINALADGGDVRKIPGLEVRDGSGWIFTGHAPARPHLDMYPRAISSRTTPTATTSTSASLSRSWKPRAAARSNATSARSGSSTSRRSARNRRRASSKS